MSLPNDQDLRAVSTGSAQAAAHLSVRDVFLVHVVAALAPHWPPGHAAARDLAKAAAEVVDAALQERHP